jgi:L-fucose dehydrogenase
MDLQLKNRIIIVNGGVEGIGNEITKVLAAEGAMPVIVGRNEEDNLHIVDEIVAAGGNALQVVGELTKADECDKAVKEIVQKFGRVDGLINNAGVNNGVSLREGDYEMFMASLNKNLIRYYLMAHYALPYLKISKGAIVNIVSKTTEAGQGGTCSYAAGNGGRNALTREWAVELLKYGIRVNAVIVDECRTPLYQRWIQTLPDTEQKLKQLTSKIPLTNRTTMAEEIANTVAFLLSERSSHTTGQLVHVDGGYVNLDTAL